MSISAWRVFCKNCVSLLSEFCQQGAEHFYTENIAEGSMSVSGISTYSSAMYQWQGQQLKNNGTASSSQSSASNSLNELFGSSTSLTSQIASMVELTKYAMDAMGLDSNSRVTFSQISKYREQLETEFNAAVKDGLAEYGVADVSKLTFALNADGGVRVAGTSALEQQAAQDWLKANPQLGTQLRAALDDAGAASGETVYFSVSDNGTLTALTPTDSNGESSLDDTERAAVQTVFNAQNLIGPQLVTGLKSLGIDPDIKFAIQVNADGSVTVQSDHADRAKVQAFFDANPDLVKKFRQIEALSGIDAAREAMQLSPSTIRKRLQIESLAAWWAGSGNNTSSFGNYGSGGLSMMSGLNLSV